MSEEKKSSESSEEYLDEIRREAFEAGFNFGQLIPRGSIYDGDSAARQGWAAYKNKRGFSKISL